MFSCLMKQRLKVFRLMVTHRHALARFTQGFPWFWNWVNASKGPRRFFNRLFINLFAYSATSRPNAMALWGPEHPTNKDSADYVSWTGLVDRSYTARQLPPADPSWVHQLPDLAKLERIFRRKPNGFVPCPRSSALLGFFAQWFTDSFLRTDSRDIRRNTSNHEIDLCQIYGLNTSDTATLREKDGGRLKSQAIDGQEYPEFLFDETGGNVRAEFRGLSYIGRPDKDQEKWDYLDEKLAKHPLLTPQRKAKLFATGIERGNVTVLFAGISTIFLREHNRLCGVLARANPHWDDDRLFETARNINIVQLLKIVIEDYVNHLSPLRLKFFIDVGMSERETWCRTNRINAEFNLLYRWHPLMPDPLELANRPLPSRDFMFNNEELLTTGVENMIDAASRQQAGRIGLFNTPEFLKDAELAGIQKSRDWRLRSYNDYRERYGLGRIKTFEEISSDAETADILRETYRSVDKLEFMVGLLAEDRVGNSPLGETLSLMVGNDAFTHVFTNPLLSVNVYGEHTFSKVGLRSIEATNSFAQLVERNRGDGSLDPLQVSFSIHSPP